MSATDTDSGSPAESPELARLRAQPERSALLLDVDGTLAPIAPTPDEASVPDETRRLLERLAAHFGLVACVSGRRALDARRLVGLDSIAYTGNHGIEYLPPGAEQAEVDERVAEDAERVRLFVDGQYGDGLRAAGVRLEDKQSIWAFHWRGARDEFGARALLEQVAANAREQGLLVHWGRKVLEIRPGLEVNKGVAVDTVLRHADAALALYAGDDATDIDAFAELRSLKEQGQIEAAVCIGVGSAEGPRQIVELADVTVQGPGGLVRLLSSLVD